MCSHQRIQNKLNQHGGTGGDAALIKAVSPVMQADAGRRVVVSRTDAEQDAWNLFPITGKIIRTRRGVLQVHYVAGAQRPDGGFLYHAG